MPGRTLVVELRPLVDDGRHWIATSDGRVSLTPIDKALIEQYDLTVEARPPSVEERLAGIPSSVDYRIVGRSLGAKTRQVGPIPLVNWQWQTPAAAIRQCPALFASASEQQCRAAMSGLGELYPLLAAGAASVQHAQQQAERLLGYRPLHPGRGNWLWRGGTLRSNVFGSPDRQYQAEYQSNDEAFGVLRQVARLRMSMQFEDDGLRAVARWELAE